MPEPTRSTPLPAPFQFELRVYWEDTDAGGVVFYANYLKFFERARTEWLRSLGHSQQQLRDETGAMFIVAETAVRYLRPARLDDMLEVTVEPLKLARVYVQLVQEALRGTQVLARAEIQVACLNVKNFKPAAIPQFLRESIQQ